MQNSSQDGASLRPDTRNETRPKVLVVIGDGAEVMDTLFPFFRLGEDYRVVVAAPEKRTYHLVTHELSDGWDITQERPGYLLNSDVAFRDVKTDEYVGLVLPGGRAPEYSSVHQGGRCDAREGGGYPRIAHLPTP